MYTAATAAANAAAGVRLDYNFAVLLPICWQVIAATVAVIVAVIVLIGSVEQASQILKRFAALLISQGCAALCCCSSRGSGSGRGRALLYVIVLLIGLLLLLATRDAFDLLILLVLLFFGLFAAALNVFC